ncbi:alpha/beta fold hydrolase [Nocardia sp. NPDC004151]|uniref:alpha/beta fold hydrolase n=1 Tax=Nocardia sp. NPDC004151 TaxID=3364304 RepID=UPI0036B9CD07
MQLGLDEWIAGGISGHDIFHRQDGPVDGRPVTLLHGFPTSSHDWAPIVPPLVESGCRVTTLDLLGFGASAKPVRHDYRITEQASIVEALWQRLGIGSTALVAHDYGVSVAQELLHRDASRITAAAFLNGGLYPDLHRPTRVQKLLHSPLGAVVQHLATERMYRKSLREILGRPVNDELLHDMWLATTMGEGKRVQHRLLHYIDERREHADRWRTALEQYPGPMLFVWGPADPVSGGHVLPRLRERLPHATITVLDEPPATGHYPQLENPDAVAAALTEFLSTGGSGS